MSLRLSIVWVAIDLVVCAGTASQAGTALFYLSELPLGTAAPGIMDITVDPNSIGSFGIYATSDVRLSGASLDIMEMGGGIKFTGATVNNPGGRWTFLDGPLVVQNSQIKSMGGAAIPLVSGNGIGPGSPELPSASSGYLIATVNYMSLGNNTASNLFLKVGSNLIADFDGVSPRICFATGCDPDDPIVLGDVVGGTDGNVHGRITVGGEVGGPPVVGDLGPLVADMSLNPPDAPTIAMGTLPASDDRPISELTWAFDGPPVGPGLPVLAPTLDPATGLFSWDVNGSKAGLYEFRIRATDVGALSDSGILSVIVAIPEPASIVLAGISFLGCCSVFRRR